jgi:hypothetical protein
LRRALFVNFAVLVGIEGSWGVSPLESKKARGADSRQFFRPNFIRDVSINGWNWMLADQT